MTLCSVILHCIVFYQITLNHNVLHCLISYYMNKRYDSISYSIALCCYGIFVHYSTKYSSITLFVVLHHGVVYYYITSCYLDSAVVFTLHTAQVTSPESMSFDRNIG